MPVALVLIAHPDDKLFVFPIIRELKQSHSIVVVYTADTFSEDGGKHREEALNSLRTVRPDQAILSILRMKVLREER